MTDFPKPSKCQLINQISFQELEDKNSSTSEDAASASNNIEATDVTKTDLTSTLPKVQQNLASKNQLALEAIRKSLANKLSVQEELSKKEDEDVQQIIVKASSNFEANRASIANALFNNNKQVVQKPISTKKQAPKPPEQVTVYRQVLLLIDINSGHFQILVKKILKY